MATFQEGVTLGKYSLQRLIGRGGMGVVYLAEDVTLGRCVALKVLDRAITLSDDFEARFRQEARTVAMLQHPNIISIHSLEWFENDLAIDMPFIENGSLADLEADRKPPLACVLHVVQDILLALACCHDAGIIHRDIKPSNILISSDGHGILSDFGLAKLLADHQSVSLRETASSGFFLGTPRYAPPESWDGKPPTPAWDVYALGMILFEAAAGRTLYDADSALALIKQLVERPVPRLSDVNAAISPEFSNLVAEMLEHDPGARLQNAGEVLERLRHVPEAGQFPDTTSMTMRLPAKPRGRRKRLGKSRLRTPGWRWAALLLVVSMSTFCLIFFSVDPDVVQLLVAHRVRTTTPAPLSSGAKDAGATVFDAFDPQTQQTWPQYALMRSGASAGKWTALAWESSRIRLFHLEQDGAGSLTADGCWAEYGDENARVFRYGTLSGAGRWVKPMEQLSLALTFLSAQDGSASPASIVLNMSERQESRQAYAKRFLVSDYGQALFYNELAPRNVTWFAEVERDFLECISPAIHVLHLRRSEAAPNIDGQLDELVWQEFVSSPDSSSRTAAPSESGNGQDILTARYDEDALYIGCRVKEEMVAPRVLAGILREFYIPLGRSPQWLLQAGRNGIEMQRCLLNEKEEDWTSSAKVAWTEDALGAQVEMRIPFSSMPGAVPEPETRWRINLLVFDGAQAGSPPVAFWGDPDFRKPELGMLMVFGERP